MPEPAVVLFSGGMDSAALLYEVRALGYEPHALLVDYKQKARRELLAARRLADIAAIRLRQIDLPLLAHFARSALTDPERTVPLHSEAARAETIVPFRNLHLLAWAASYACLMGIRRLWFGGTLDDAAVYPDCRDRFLTALGAALGWAMPELGLMIERPFLFESKATVLKGGLALGVPYELTWSCYAGGEEPCRHCDACASRAAAWAEVGLPDPALEGR